MQVDFIKFWCSRIRCRCVVLLLLLSCVFCSAHSVMAQEVNEEQIKAVFLYNLTHFVTWPEGVVESHSTFNIGVFGDEPFRRALSETVEAERKEDRSFVVTEIKNLSEITDRCRIIFISGANSANWNKIREKLEGLPILTVSDQKGFTQRGGMVNLIRQKKKIQIEVNYKAVQQAGLSMSAKLLRLAQIVE